MVARGHRFCARPPRPSRSARFKICRRGRVLFRRTTLTPLFRLAPHVVYSQLDTGRQISVHLTHDTHSLNTVQLERGYTCEMLYNRRWSALGCSEEAAPTPPLRCLMLSNLPWRGCPKSSEINFSDWWLCMDRVALTQAAGVLPQALPRGSVQNCQARQVQPNPRLRLVTARGTT
jgi:hypothetical protein